MDSGSGTTGGGSGYAALQPCCRMLRESCKGLGSVSLKINNQHTQAALTRYRYRYQGFSYKENRVLEALGLAARPKSRKDPEQRLCVGYHASHITVVLSKAAHSGPSVCLRARAPCPLRVSRRVPERIARRAANLLYAERQSVQRELQVLALPRLLGKTILTFRFP